MTTLMGAGFALPSLCLASCWASEAALSRACQTYNLTVLFERPLGWPRKVMLRNWRFRRFVTDGGLSHAAGLTAIKRTGPDRDRAW